MPPVLPLLGLGLVLGLQHATEADHLTTVTTILTHEKNPLRAALVGAYWGLGHTVTLLLVGFLVLVLRFHFPESLHAVFELCVAGLIIGLGVKALLHAGETHDHPHDHTRGKRTHKTSFLIGSLHGLAGSGAILLVVVSSLQSISEGLWYITVFGVGSIIGMTVISLLVGIPVALANKKVRNVHTVIHLLAGTLSIIVGLHLAFRILSAHYL